MVDTVARDDWNGTEGLDYWNETKLIDVNNTMSNVSQEILPEDLDPLPGPVVQYIWIFGIALSSLCLILQLVLFKIKPKIRKMDQKILTQLTAARLMNTILEFVMSFMLFNLYTRDLTFALYLQTDAVLICWMFVYTKNLYDKVVLVFALQRWNFVVLSLLIWILTIPLGVLCPVFLMLDYFTKFYEVYVWLKFIVLTINILFFGRIFYVIITRSHNSNRNFKDIIKTYVISFTLVCLEGLLTSLQVFVIDIMWYFADTMQSHIFCIINSFQAIAATIIFLIVTKSALDRC